MPHSNKFAKLMMTGLLASSAMMLGGCQSIFGFHSRTASALPRLEQRLPDDFGSMQLAAGRKALGEGRTADAVDSFMVARLYPADAAAAYNGLAVAYSRMGRADLTERFFKKAIALAPQDGDYQANLALFYSRNGAIRSVLPTALAVQQVAAEATRIALVDAPAPKKADARRSQVIHFADGITAQDPDTRIQRVSSREVTITTTSDNDASDKVAVYAPRPAVYEIHTRARTESTAPAYPVRISLSDSTPPESKKLKRPSYPIRIELRD